MNELRIEKLSADIEALMGNETFVQAVLNAGSIENIVRVLESYGIASTEKEVSELAKEGAAVLAPSEDELSLEDLEAVAGGGKWRGRLCLAGALLVGAALRGICGAAIAASDGLATPVVGKIAVGYTAFATATVVSAYAAKGW